MVNTPSPTPAIPEDQEAIIESMVDKLAQKYPLGTQEADVIAAPFAGRGLVSEYACYNYLYPCARELGIDDNKIPELAELIVQKYIDRIGYSIDE